MVFIQYRLKRTLLHISYCICTTVYVHKTLNASLTEEYPQRGVIMSQLRTCVFTYFYYVVVENIIFTDLAMTTVIQFLFQIDCFTFWTDYCPEFNTGAWALDTVPCNVTTGCPNVTFLSNEVYKCKNNVFHTFTDESV